jgi:hypothetical protein
MTCIYYGRYWIEAKTGLKEQELFEQGVKKAWDWAVC